MALPSGSKHWSFNLYLKSFLPLKQPVKQQNKIKLTSQQKIPDFSTYHKHWGSHQVLVQDRKGLAQVAEQDIAGGVQHKEGHYDGTTRQKIQSFLNNRKIIHYRTIQLSA